MPFKIQRKGNEWCVVNSETGEERGCSVTQSMASAHMKALYAATAGEKAIEAGGEKAYVGSWEVEMRQLDHYTAGYNPVGGDGSKACSNCRWFVHPDGCVIVAGAIAPNGMSEYWEALPDTSPQPIPVRVTNPEEIAVAAKGDDDDAQEAEDEETQRLIASGQRSNVIVDAPQEILAALGSGVAPATTAAVTTSPRVDGIFDRVKSWALGSKSEEPVVVDEHPQTFWVHRNKENRLRFFIRFSNHFVDRHGEVLRQSAQKEYVDYLNDTGKYPELWPWHSVYKLGQCDWADYSDGFAFVSGLAEPGKEEVLERWAKNGIGISHGFLGAWHPATKEWSRYRSYEVTGLPRVAQANPWGMHFSVVEGNMSFSEARRKWLVEEGGVPAEELDAVEKDTEALNRRLAQFGVKWKEIDPELSSTATPPVTPVTPVTSVAPATTPPGTTETVPATGVKGVEEETVSISAVRLKSLEDTIAALQTTVSQSDDERLAQAYASRLGNLPKGFQATREKSTEIGEESEEVKEDFSWATKGVWGGVRAAAAQSSSQ